MTRSPTRRLPKRCLLACDAFGTLFGIALQMTRSRLFSVPGVLVFNKGTFLCQGARLGYVTCRSNAANRVARGRVSGATLGSLEYAGYCSGIHGTSRCSSAGLGVYSSSAHCQAQQGGSFGLSHECSQASVHHDGVVSGLGVGNHDISGRQGLATRCFTSEQVGGKANEDVLAALFPVAQRSKTHYMATLDYSKALEYSSPRLLVAALVWCVCFLFGARYWKYLEKPNLGLRGTGTTWLMVFISPMQSLPQGDPASPMGLNAVLSFAVRMLKNNWPNSKNLLFLDDRSWASPTPDEAVQVLHAWHEFFASYGLREVFPSHNFSRTKPL